MRIRPPCELGDLADRLVEQIAVVRDGDDGPVEGGDEALEQRAADGVEVRFRLIEQEDIGILGEAGGERDQLSLATREGVGRQRQVGLLEPEVEQHRPPAAVDARPSGLLPAVDELLLAAENARHLVEIRGERRRGELVGDAVQLTVELVQVGPCRADRLERVPLVPEWVLREERNDDSAAADGGARVGLLEPGDEPEHGRLAGAVRADHADAGARLDREVQAVEHGSAAERLADGVQADQRHGATRCERWRARTRPCRRAAHRRGGRRPRSRFAR